VAVGLKIIDGDFVINRSGQVETVVESEKCKRDLHKMLMTSAEYPGNTTTFERYNPNYGTQLDNLSLYQGLSRLAIRDTVIQLLNEAIASYITLQESRTNLSIGEVITYINFDVFYNVDDIRELVVRITFGTAGTTGDITLPDYIQSIQ